MPPRKAVAVPLGFSTRNRTRSNRADLGESPTKKIRHDAPSTDESDIEVDLEDSVVQVICLHTHAGKSNLGFFSRSCSQKLICSSGS